MANRYTISLKRVYEKKAKDDGFRILVDRLWPRGLSKEKVKADLWIKEIAPSHQLRKWFGHDPAKWDEFQIRYQKELFGNRARLAEIKETLGGKKNVTLVYSASDEKHNHAVVIKNLLSRA